MTTAINHPTLNATLHGITDDRYDSKVIHYRGIQYGKIAKRFAKPQAISDLGPGDIDCTSFG